MMCPHHLRVLALLTLLLPLSLAAGQGAYQASGPETEFDFRGQDWGGSGTIVSLDGSWFLDDEEIIVPGRVMFSNGLPYGQGTYRTRILVDNNAKNLALRIPAVGIAMELRVNGQIMAQLGTPAASEAEEVPKYNAIVVILPPPDQGVYHLELTFSNHQDIYAGITYSLRFGTIQAVMAEREYALVMETIVFGGLLLLGLYHFGSFFFRTKNKSTLWLSLLGLSMGIRSAMYGELVALAILPGLPWIVIIKGVYVTMALASLAFLHYLRHLYPTLSWKWFYPWSWVAIALYGSINILAPIKWSTTLLPLFQICMLIWGVYGLQVIFRAFLKHQAGAVIFLAGLSIFIFTVALDIAKIYFLWPLPSLVNQGLLAFMLSQALLVARVFSNNLTLVENYSVSMEKLNLSLERFIPREVLGLLNKKDITEISLGNYTERHMAVFFLDIRDFTTLSESMTPQENFAFINSFLRRFGPLIRQNGGFVDKYLGDGILALFPGGPFDALNAAKAMRQELIDYNLGRARAGHAAIRFGIGIHTGQLMLGTIGENQRMDSTVISDTVNVASRLEGLTKKLGLDILVSEATIQSLPAQNGFGFKYLAHETVKGKSHPMAVYTLLDGDLAVPASP